MLKQAVILLLALFSHESTLSSAKKIEEQYKDVQMLRRAKPTDLYKDVSYPRRLNARNYIHILNLNNLNQTPMSGFESLESPFESLKLNSHESIESHGSFESFGSNNDGSDWQN